MEHGSNSTRQFSTLMIIFYWQVLMTKKKTPQKSHLTLTSTSKDKLLYEAQHWFIWARNDQFLPVIWVKKGSVQSRLNNTFYRNFISMNTFLTYCSHDDLLNTSKWSHLKRNESLNTIDLKNNVSFFCTSNLSICQISIEHNRCSFP